MFHVKHMTNTAQSELPSLDFIAGLIAAEGIFMQIKQKNQTIHVFQLKMHTVEYELLEQIKQRLGLKEKIHRYSHQNREYVLLLVRKRASIENSIIPVFTGRLFGKKKQQFDLWVTTYNENKKFFKYRQHI